MNRIESIAGAYFAAEFTAILAQPSHSAAFQIAMATINKAIDARIERDVESGK